METSRQSNIRKPDWLAFSLKYLPGQQNENERTECPPASWKIAMFNSLRPTEDAHSADGNVRNTIPFGLTIFRNAENNSGVR